MTAKKHKTKTPKRQSEKHIKEADINEEQVLRVPVRLELVSSLTPEEHIERLLPWNFIPPYGAWSAES